MSCGGLPPAYPVEELLGFAAALFRGAGLDADKAGTVAEILVWGDLLDHTTHCLALAAPYLAALPGERASHAGARPARPASISIPGSWMHWRRGPRGSRSPRPRPRTD